VRKRILVPAALVVFGLVLALAALELGLRWYYASYGSERERLLYLADRAALDARAAQLIGVPYLNYTLNPEFSDDVNNRGLRGEAVAVPKPEETYRILAVGGSTTFGHGLSVDDAWPAQLQRILRARGHPQVEVINLSAPGYYSLDSVVHLATRGLALQPDLIIDYDGLNDVVVRMYQDPGCYGGDTPLFGMGLDRGLWQASTPALPASVLYRVLALRFGWMDDPTVYTSRLQHTGLCPPEPQGVSPLALLEQNPPVYFERNLRSIIALARGAGAEVMLSSFAWDERAAEATLAADPSLDGTRALLEGIAAHNLIAQQVAQDTRALWVDLAASMGDGAYFQGDHIHQTDEGARRQAEVYADALEEAQIIGG
jgi:lysophospholipase L1-like esterase